MSERWGEFGPAEAQGVCDGTAAALDAEMALRKDRETIQREALACMCWLGRLIEEGDAP